MDLFDSEVVKQWKEMLSIILNETQIAKVMKGPSVQPDRVVHDACSCYPCLCSLRDSIEQEWDW